MSGKPVARQGDKTSGHSVYSPRATKGPGVGSSTDVFVNSLGVNRAKGEGGEGDEWKAHIFLPGIHGLSLDYDHRTEAGSASVFANNRPIARIGDPVDKDGDAIAAGSPDVFVGDALPFTVPPVQIDVATQAAINKKTEAYVANPSKYQVSSNNQVKAYYPGTPDIPASSGVSLIDTTSVQAGDIVPFLTQVLTEADKGQWDETGMGGRPSNPNILNIWKELGFGNNGAWGSDQTAWCMGFVNYVLKKTGHRFVQTAGAKDIANRAAQYKVTQIPLNQGLPGDICLWSYSHVNFIYQGGGGKYVFVGGNQSTKAKNANNPSGGAVTKSWPNGYKAPGDGSLVSIWRPSKA